MFKRNKRKDLVNMKIELNKCELKIRINGEITQIKGSDVLSIIQYSDDRENFIQTVTAPAVYRSRKQYETIFNEASHQDLRYAMIKRGNLKNTDSITKDKIIKRIMDYPWESKEEIINDMKGRK